MLLLCLSVNGISAVEFGGENVRPRALVLGVGVNIIDAGGVPGSATLRIGVGYGYI